MSAKIYESIANVMSEVGAVGKDSYNQMQKFKFRGIDAVMNALHPALAKNHVFVVPEVLEQTREERQTSKGANLIYSICKIKYTFYADDGSNISAVVIGEGMDSGDKATNKAMAIALKYAFFQVFCIPTEEMQDPDAESPEVVAKPDNIGKQKIPEVKIKTLVKMCETGNVAVDKIKTLYKVDSFADLTENQFKNIVDHWEKIKAAE